MIRLALWSLRNPWPALGVWLAVVVGFGINAITVESQLGSPEIRTAGSASDRADIAGARTFGRTTSIPVLLTGPATTVDRQARTLTRALTDDTERTVLTARTHGLTPPVRRLLHPSPRARVLLVTAATSQAIDGAAGTAVQRIVDRTVHAPVRSAVTGFSRVGGAFADESVKAVRKSEKLAVPILLLILLFVFRSPIAASLPLLLGVGSTVSGLGLLGLTGRVADVADIALSVCSLLGLALGVDYSLLLLSRFREELRHGQDHVEAARVAVESAGRTVVFAAVAILVVMTGLLVSAPGANAASAAAGPMCGAIAALFGAMTAMPALLVLLGPRVNSYRIGPAPSDGGGRWGDVARWAQRRPILAMVPAVIALAAFGPPALGLDTGPPDPRTLPGDSPVRIDAERVAAAVGPGLLSPFVVDTRVRGSAPRLRRQPGVQAVIGPEVHGATRRYTVIARTAPNDPRTARLYDRLRKLKPPLLVGGIAAQLTDAGRDIAGGFAPMVIVITLLTAVALLVVLRAIVLPLVCVVINLVSVMTAMGCVALLCTGSDPPFGGPGFADNTALLGTFAIIFALSLDYQVFVLERIREEWDRTGSVELAITQAVDQTARVITGAAAILVGVFATFALPELQTLRQSGVGLTVAVIVDATLVRLVLLPAAITLIGPRSFWLPGR